MSKEEKELMEQYIYQVLKHIPRKQRDEIRLELEEMISDMAEECGSVRETLTKLGDPAKLAGKYTEDSGYLIGPEYFDTYKWFLTIILLCSITPILIISIVDGFRGISMDPSSVGMVVDNTVEVFSEAFSNVLSSLVGVFGGVTLIFAILERQKVKIDIKNQKAFADKPWTPEQLSPLPNKKALIDRKDSIISIVFTTLFCILLIFAPHLFNIILKVGDETISIPVFNLQSWNIIMPLFVLSLLIGMVDDIVRLIRGVYCGAVMISGLVTGALQIVLAFIVLKVLPFWNTDLPNVLAKFPKEANEMIFIWNLHSLSNIILTFIVVITLVQMLVTVLKTVIYGEFNDSNATATK